MTVAVALTAQCVAVLASPFTLTNALPTAACAPSKRVHAIIRASKFMCTITPTEAGGTFASGTVHTRALREAAVRRAQLI